MAARPIAGSEPTSKAGIMQPYFFPYIGYFQLIDAVDRFVVYDQIKYTKKGWINRNRMLVNGQDVLFSLPLKNASDSLDICERELAADFDPRDLLNKIAGAYRRAPFFGQAYPLVEEVVYSQDRNLFQFLYHSIVTTCRHLGIATDITASSEIAVDRSTTGQDRVLAICRALGAGEYINAIGGEELYSRDEFRRRGIVLKFINSRPFEYPQFGPHFVPSLSIIDVLMFNSQASVRAHIADGFDLI
jgi:hypothetical protein